MLLFYLFSDKFAFKTYPDREILNDEVIGTSKIAELKDGAISMSEKKDSAILEKKIASQKQKINDTMLEISKVKEQVSGLEAKIQQVLMDKV